jgi:hypothetical protein
VDDATDFTERMRIDSSGRVIIGATNPAAAANADDLCVGNNDGSGESGITLGSNTASPIRWADGASNSAAVFEFEHGSTNAFITGTNDTERMRIDSSGRLLVGLTSTNQDSAIVAVSSISGGGQGVITALDSSSNDFGCGLVVGKNSTTTTSAQRFIQFYSDTLTQPMGGIVGNGTENVQFTTLSDERYKKNIKPISNILEKINKLKTISFDWKHKEESVNAGFIAQNVQEIFPEYVVDNIGNDEANKKMGTTGGMSAGYIAVLTAAIQELSAKVAALEAA